MAMEICMKCSGKSSKYQQLESGGSYREGTEELDEVVSIQGNGNRINCKSSNGNRKRYACGWDDDRVVSTELQEVEVVMKVTVFAGGFVIGVRGATVRDIGQATGALINSWIETDCNCVHSATALPLRLFRIQGTKPAVRDAVYVIKEAVAKYRALCECNRRGEFVPGEHLINGLHFFYQPPPKMPLPPLKNKARSLNLSPNHVWSMPQMHSPAFACNCFGQFKHHHCFKRKDAAVYDGDSVSPAKNRGGSSFGSTYSRLELFQCQGFKQEEIMPKSMNTELQKISAEKVEEKMGDSDMQDEKEREKQEEQMECSLFSNFGPQGLPLPISPYSYTSPFDFPSCQFSGGEFPCLSFASPHLSSQLQHTWESEKEKFNNIHERS